ncbi:MAG TPA: class I SAM-dependent methyltransferase [Streptosporangiaceae bacterium]|jgi:SAM-dependent methyltransferase
MMDRAAWVAERRRRGEERFDTLLSLDYDQKWGAISESHRRWVGRLLGLCPPGGRLLDAACGTGKYLGMATRAGLVVTGMDQSAGMLAKARAKYPDVRLEKAGLQELAYQNEFDVVMCVDAMEYVFPEHWPLVAGNLARAAREDGHVYLTVEVVGEDEREQAYAASLAAGVPAVPGEHANGGYHYYPEDEQVLAWLARAGLDIVHEERADYYWHLLTRRTAGG